MLTVTFFTENGDLFSGSNFILSVSGDGGVLLWHETFPQDMPLRLITLSDETSARNFIEAIYNKLSQPPKDLLDKGSLSIPCRKLAIKVGLVTKESKTSGEGAC